MSIIYAEGFDDGVIRGTAGGNVAPTIQTTSPMTGTRYLRAQTGSNLQSSSYVANHANLTTGFHYFRFATSAINGAWIWLAADNGVTHLLLQLRSDGRFEVYRGFGLTSLGVGTYIYPGSGAIIGIGIKFTINDTTGSFELRINGNPTPDINLSGIDTRNAGNAYVNQMYVGQLNSNINTTGAPFNFDDLIVQNTSGSAPENDWLTDPQVDYLFPNAAGDNSDGSLTGSVPAATRHAALSDFTSGDDVATVTSSTAGDKVLMNCGDLTGAGTIYAVSPLIRMKKSAAGGRTVRCKVKSGGTEQDGTTFSPGTSHATYQTDFFHRDPAAAVWTATTVNAAQVGFETVT